MAIKRYLVLIAVLVGMGLCTVWWKTQTLNMGYEAVRLEGNLRRAEEEERLEDSLLSGLMAPKSMARRVRELGNRIAAGSGAAGGRRRGAMEARSLAAAVR